MAIKYPLTSSKLIDLQYDLQIAIESIGEFLVYRKLTAENPCHNNGESYQNRTFALSSYCWCEGDRHPQGCPQNFVCEEFNITVHWYKHIGRGSYQNRTMTLDEIEQMRRKCIDSLPSACVNARKSEFPRAKIAGTVEY